jgi:putative addiction module component (TIGR02574 family)
VSNSAIQKIRDDAMKLPDADKADLADLLWSSVADQAVIDAAWDSEIAHRVAELDAGRTKSVSAESVFAKSKEIIDRLKK